MAKWQIEKKLGILFCPILQKIYLCTEFSNKHLFSFDIIIHDNGSTIDRKAIYNRS